jgi:hypothetical protein
MSDFFTSYGGSSPNSHSRRRRIIGAMIDPLLDMSLAALGIGRIDNALIPRRVLLVGIEVPGRTSDIHVVFNRMKRYSRHCVLTATIPMAPGLGKFANAERALSGINLKDFDWLLIADDDIAFGSRMLDRLITLSEKAGLSISQPAHTRSSFAGYEVTLRKVGALVRETHFVEIGPVTAFRRDVFSAVIPFPPSRWCYGIDLVWSELARRKGFKMGIVDAAPVRHLRPVANSYNIDAAIAEGKELIKTLDGLPSRADILGFQRVVPV